MNSIQKHLSEKARKNQNEKKPFAEVERLLSAGKTDQATKLLEAIKKNDKELVKKLIAKSNTKN